MAYLAKGFLGPISIPQGKCLTDTEVTPSEQPGRHPMTSRYPSALLPHTQVRMEPLGNSRTGLEGPGREGKIQAEKLQGGLSKVPPLYGS
ncbi:protein FAM53C [Platysternon megacephalum]|uniref:Protein FAM53C n=1 Tax=Platysternon megacephalum TaxID=55544 RepID=A0A4D9DVJ9_9SAUR|nr:protein FAM53C [Platysternon megacephalum]